MRTKGIDIYKKLIELRSKKPLEPDFLNELNAFSEEDLLSLMTAVFIGRMIFEGLGRNDSYRAAKTLGANSKQPIVNYLFSLPQNSFFQFFEMARSFESNRSVKS